MKIALLLLDDFLTTKGEDFADLGQELLTSALAGTAAGEEIVFEKFDYASDLNNLPKISDVADYSCIYLTGSRKDSYMDVPFNNRLIEFLKSVLENEDLGHVKLVGICFGHQILARALGLTTLPSSRGWEMGNTEVSLQDEGALLDDEIPTSFTISEMHRDVVKTPLSTAEMERLTESEVAIFGTSEKCNVQGLYKRGKLLTFQGHPEFDSTLTMEMITQKYNAGIVDKAFYDDAVERFNTLTEDGRDLNGPLKLQKWLRSFVSS